MKIIIFGGRFFSDWVSLCRAMEPYRGQGEALTIISGGAKGADSLGEKWAEIYRAKIERYPAEWRLPDGSYDMLAGFKRNQQMIDDGKPDKAIECPGGAGTRDMHRRLMKAGIPIEYVDRPVASLFN